VLSWPIWPHVYTLIVVMIGWVFFRAADLPSAVTYLRAMFGFGVGEFPALRLSWYLNPEVRLALVAGIVGSMPIVPALTEWARRIRPARALATECAGALALVAVFMAVLLQVASRSYNPFIYFRF